MLIRILYTEGGFDMVKPERLDLLLEEQLLTSFKRSDGWAVVGRDPIRRTTKPDYSGPERRHFPLPAQLAAPLTPPA